MKYILTILIVVATATAFVFLLPEETAAPTREDGKSMDDKPKESTVREVDERAAFAIFTNDTFRTFTHERYHFKSPKVFLTPDTPNVLVIKEEGVTWQDFFNTLPMKLSKDCLVTGTGQTFCSSDAGTLRFYLNGKRDDDLLKRAINEGDKALISYGSDESQISEQLTRIPNPRPE